MKDIRLELGLADLPGEEWMDVYGYDGYYHVSNLGRVKSLPRPVRCGGGGVRTIRERIMKQGFDSLHGLWQVTLCVDYHARTFNVSKVVYCAFNGGPPPDDMVVMHKNKVKTDDRLSNLVAATRSVSNKTNYDLGVSTHRDIGSRTAAEADELDRLLIMSPTTRICRVCKRELPDKVFAKPGVKRPYRSCLDCRLVKRGVIAVGKQRNADELFAAGLRRCNPCGRTLPLTDFGPSRSSFGGRNHICYPCARAKNNRLRSTKRLITTPCTPSSFLGTHRSGPEGSGA